MGAKLLLDMYVWRMYNVYTPYKKIYGGLIMSLVRLSMNMEEDLLKALDDYAASMHINRSAALHVALSEFFNQRKTMDTLGKLLEVYQQADGNGKNNLT